MRYHSQSHCFLKFLVSKLQNLLPSLVCPDLSLCWHKAGSSVAIHHRVLQTMPNKQSKFQHPVNSTGQGAIVQHDCQERLTSDITLQLPKWTSSDWKEELSAKAQQHMGQLEQQAEKWRKERDQKQCQLDSLEQVRSREGGLHLLLLSLIFT